MACAVGIESFDAPITYEIAVGRDDDPHYRVGWGRGIDMHGENVITNSRVDESVVRALR